MVNSTAMWSSAACWLALLVVLSLSLGSMAGRADSERAQATVSVSRRQRPAPPTPQQQIYARLGAAGGERLRSKVAHLRKERSACLNVAQTRSLSGAYSIELELAPGSCANTTSWQLERRALASVRRAPARPPPRGPVAYNPAGLGANRSLSHEALSTVCMRCLRPQLVQTAHGELGLEPQLPEGLGESACELRLELCHPSNLTSAEMDAHPNRFNLRMSLYSIDLNEQKAFFSVNPSDDQRSCLTVDKSYSLAEPGLHLHCTPDANSRCVDYEQLVPAPGSQHSPKPSYVKKKARFFLDECHFGDSQLFFMHLFHCERAPTRLAADPSPSSSTPASLGPSTSAADSGAPITEAPSTPFPAHLRLVYPPELIAEDDDHRNRTKKYNFNHQKLLHALYSAHRR